MNDHRPPDRPLSPQEKLANLYGSFAEDVLAGHVEIDEDEEQRAYLKGQEILERARRLRPLTNHVPATAPDAPARRRGLSWWQYWFGFHPATAVALTIIALPFPVIGLATFGMSDIVFVLLAGLITWTLQRRLYRDRGLPLLLKSTVPSVLLLITPVKYILPFVIIPAGIVGFLWRRTVKHANPIPKPLTK